MSEDIRNEMTAPRGRHPLFWLDLLLPLVLLAITTPLFHIYNWDMRLQGYFYHPSDGWVTGEQGFFQFLYKFGNIPALLLTLTALYVLIRGFSSIAMSRWRKAAIYLVAVLIIGPGLIVNTLLKDQWGRPRPREVTEFGGKYAYEAPLEIDPDSPGKSFPCGHATMGFFFFAPAFLLRRKHPHASLLLALSAAGLGILIGVARMTQGGHFASDVIWAGALIWLTAAGLYYLLKLDLRLWSQVNKRNPKKLKPVWKALLWILGLGMILGVGLATPHKSKRSYNWDSVSKVRTIELLAEDADLTLSFGDRSRLRSLSSGFGFPGSKLNWKKSAAGADSFRVMTPTQKRSGLFTELHNQATLVADSLATELLKAALLSGDIKLDGSGISSLPALELRTGEGDIELLLPSEMKLSVWVEEAQNIEDQHPGVEVITSGPATAYRLSVPNGKLSIKVPAK